MKLVMSLLLYAAVSNAMEHTLDTKKKLENLIDVTFGTDQETFDALRTFIENNKHLTISNPDHRHLVTHMVGALQSNKQQVNELWSILSDYLHTCKENGQSLKEENQ